VNALFHLLANSPSLLGLMAMGICWATNRRLRWFWITAGACCVLFLINDILVERWMSRWLAKDYGPHGASVVIPSFYMLVCWCGLMLLRHAVELCRCWKERPQRFFALLIVLVATLVISGAMWMIGIGAR
jgi:hypothetical protein